jgi:hypothetical protein
MGWVRIYVMQLSLWRRVAMYLLWKMLDLLFLIDRCCQRRRADADQPVRRSGFRDITKKR